MAYSAGDVVLVPFPYRDRTAVRTRPTVVVSGSQYNQHGDVIVAAITSHPSRGAWDYELLDWLHTGLKVPSTVRMQLATAADFRIVAHLGHLTDRDLQQVALRLGQVFS